MLRRRGGVCSTGRCSRRLLREPQPPAPLLNWPGSPRTLTVLCEMRLRGWRSGLRAGLFVLAARSLLACLVCLLAIVFVLWIRTAPVAMLAPPQARRSEARRGGDPGGGRRRGQQCFLCRGSRAQCEPRQRFFAARQASSNAPARSRPVFPHQEVPLASSSRYTGISALVGHKYPRFWTKHERARLAGSPLYL